MSDKIDQTVTGDRSIIAGSGNLTVNNITHIHSGETPEPENVDLADEAKLGTPFGVPNLPPRYLERDDYLDQFREALLSGETQTVGITGRPQYVGVQGMGGLGKSVLAAALAWDEQVRRAFPDGIFWLRFGQEVDKARLLELQKEILKVLAPDSLPESPAQGQNLLNLVLQDKRCLLIADDLWESRHLKYFDLNGTECRFFLTSRKADVLERLGIEGKRIDLLSRDQALAMLAQYTGFPDDDLPKEATEIVKECGYLPLAVAAIGSMIQNKPADRWHLALHKLQEAKLDKIICKFDYPYEDLFRAFQVSVEALPEPSQQYYETLVIFPRDSRVDESVVNMYWMHCAFSDDEPLDVIDNLVDASLLNRNKYGTLGLHDLLHDYLTSRTENVVPLHKQLLDAYKAAYPKGWHTIPYELFSYFYRYWHIHARKADDMAQAAAIANDLLYRQPELDMEQVQEALKFVHYELIDIAPHLLKIHGDPFIFIRDCLDALGDKGIKEAKRLLRNDPDIFTVDTCLKFLGNMKRVPNEKIDLELVVAPERFSDKGRIEARRTGQKEAKRLIKDTKVFLYDGIIAACMKFLGDEGKEYLGPLLKEKANGMNIGTYLSFLGDESKKYVRQLLHERPEPFMINSCLEFLGDEGVEEAKRLLKEYSHLLIISPCLDFLGDRDKEYVKHLLREGIDPSIMIFCLKALGDDGIEEARQLLKKDSNPIIIALCLEFLGNTVEKKWAETFGDLNGLKRLSEAGKGLSDVGKEKAQYIAKKEAWRLVKEYSDPVVVGSCLNFLGDDGKEEARRLLKEQSDQGTTLVSLLALGDEGKEKARCLLKERSELDVVIPCLALLRDEGKDDARRLLKEHSDPSVLYACLKLLGDEGKKAARQIVKEQSNLGVIASGLKFLGYQCKNRALQLLKENPDPAAIFIACLTILGEEGKEEARRMLKGNFDPDILMTCLIVLEDEGKEEARRLLKKDNRRVVIATCLFFFGDEGKEEAWRLLKKSPDREIISTCLQFLGYESKDDARRWLREYSDPSIITFCLILLIDEGKEEARKLLQESSDPDVIFACLDFLGDEGKEEARRLLKQNPDSSVISICLDVLCDEGVEEAWRFLKDNSDPRTIFVCLDFLGDEGKEEAQRLIKKDSKPGILAACLLTLGDEGKEEAWRLLKSSNNEKILVFCIRFLGKEAEDYANQLIKNSKDQNIIGACQELISSWNDSPHSNASELTNDNKRTGIPGR